MARHPNLSDQINDNIEASEKADSIDLSVIGEGVTISFQTRNTHYTATRLSDGWWLVKGNPKFFDNDHGTRTKIIGSTWGGSMIKINTIFVGGHVEMVRETDPAGYLILTSVVTKIGTGPKSDKVH